MPNRREPTNDPTAPLAPKAVDGAVLVENPPADPLELTADAAEISALRLMDAADAARRRF
jgi:hypothetical protein